MEKSLIEKLKNDSCDDIDKEMIVSRVLNAVKHLQTVCDDFSKNIKKVYEDYGDELKMAGASVVMGVNVSTLNKNPDCLTKIVIGSNQNVQVIINDLLEETK
jgi:hypothetical protein